jgi:hypothetical protein
VAEQLRLQDLTPEQVEAETRTMWIQIDEALAHAENRDFPEVADIPPIESSEPSRYQGKESGYLHVAKVVTKQLGSVALFPGRAYWNAVKWGYKHVTEER